MITLLTVIGVILTLCAMIMWWRVYSDCDKTYRYAPIIYVLAVIGLSCLAYVLHSIH